MHFINSHFKCDQWWDVSSATFSLLYLFFQSCSLLTAEWIILTFFNKTFLPHHACGLAHHSLSTVYAAQVKCWTAPPSAVYVFMYGWLQNVVITDWPISRVKILSSEVVCVAAELCGWFSFWGRRNASFEQAWFSTDCVAKLRHPTCAFYYLSFFSRGKPRIKRNSPSLCVPLYDCVCECPCFSRRLDGEK